MWIDNDPRLSAADVIVNPNVPILLKEESVPVDGVYKMFQFADARRLVTKTGLNVASVCSYILLRVRHVNNADPYIRTVFPDVACAAFRRASRIYSGIMKLPQTPPVEVRRWLIEELKAGVPRNYMGKSIFGLQSKLFCFIFKFFEVPSSLKYYNADICNAQPSLLYTSSDITDEQRSQLRILGDIHHHRERVISDLMRGLNVRVKPALCRGNIKVLIVAAMGQMSFQTFLEESERSLSAGPRNDAYTNAIEMYNFIREDAVAYSTFLEIIFPDACEWIRHNRSNFVGSLIRRYSNILERRLVDRECARDQTFRDEGRMPIDGQKSVLGNEHDGWGVLAKNLEMPRNVIVAHGSGEITIVYTPQPATVQSLCQNVNEYLQEHGYSVILSMEPARLLPAQHFIILMRNCITYFRDGRARAQDSQVTTLLSALLEGMATATSTEIEVFDTGRLYVSKRSSGNDALTRLVRDLLKTFFGRRRQTSWREDTLFFEPIAPAGSDAYINARTSNVLNHLSAVNLGPRDWDSDDKLLCRDGWYYDYVAQSWFRNTLRTRLFRVCGKTRSQLDDLTDMPQALRDLIATFWAAVGNFEVTSGVSVGNESEIDDSSVRNAFELVMAHDQTQWFKVQYLQQLHSDIKIYYTNFVCMNEYQILKLLKQ